MLLPVPMLLDLSDHVTDLLLERVARRLVARASQPVAELGVELLLVLEGDVVVVDVVVRVGVEHRVAVDRLLVVHLVAAEQQLEREAGPEVAPCLVDVVIRQAVVVRQSSVDELPCGLKHAGGVQHALEELLVDTTTDGCDLSVDIPLPEAVGKASFAREVPHAEQRLVLLLSGILLDSLWERSRRGSPHAGAEPVPPVHLPFVAQHFVFGVDDVPALLHLHSFCRLQRLLELIHQSQSRFAPRDVLSPSEGRQGLAKPGPGQ
mmetsp:Transcript_14852/g.58252  ORF Transcript_14852/g.58252 Transcript_14852/m.58252 type:complete len:263 (+) Transcript_14852:646-1434(+)